jgi:CBS domain-containing protein
MRQTESIAKGRDPRSLMVRDLMEKNVVTCQSRTTAADIAGLMSERNFGSLPVVAEDGVLVGLVSE